MENRTIPSTLDLNRYRKIIKRINEDELSDRAEGRTTSIAALILEGGLTFQPSEIYYVAIFVGDFRELKRYHTVFTELRRGSDPFRDEYFVGGIELQRDNFTITISDWDGNTRIKVKFFVLSFLAEQHLRGVQFHNYFIDIDRDNSHISRLFSTIPVVRDRLRENISR